MGKVGRRKSQNQAKKTEVKATKRGTFSSKLVGDSFNSVIENHLKSVKTNSKTVKLWLTKMKVSILQKVSICSRTLFAPAGATADDYESKIVEMSKLIQEKYEQIRQMETEPINIPKNRRKETNLQIPKEAFNQAITSLEHNLVQVSKISAELVDRNDVFRTGLASIQEGWTGQLKSVSLESSSLSPAHALHQHLLSSP